MTDSTTSRGGSEPGSVLRTVSEAPWPWFNLSITCLFLHLWAWALPPSLSCAFPRLITRSGVLETREQQPGGQSSPICFHSLLSFSSCLFGWRGRETLQPPPLPWGCGGAGATVSTGRSGPAFCTGRYFHAVNGFWPRQPGPSVWGGCSHGARLSQRLRGACPGASIPWVQPSPAKVP